MTLDQYKSPIILIQGYVCLFHGQLVTEPNEAISSGSGFVNGGGW